VTFDVLKPFSVPPAAFAIPGDITRRTGGFIYERSLLEALRAGGRDVTLVNVPGSFPTPTERDIRVTLEALQTVPSNRPLILDGFLSGTLPTDGLAAIPAPWIAMTHHPLALETGLTPERADWLEQRERANLSLAHHVLVPSPHTSDLLQVRYGVPDHKITVVLPGFARPPSVAAPKGRTDPPLILAVGLLAPRKGHDTLLDALARIGALEWEAVIVGGIHDAAYARELQRQRDRLGLVSQVRLAGELEGPELEALFSKASIFALATRYEGYGMVFAEALLHGLPIVGCRGGAVSDTVPAEAGLLVDVDDVTGFSEAMRDLLTDPQKRTRMAEAARAAGARLPTWSQQAKLVGGVLDRLAASAS